MRRGPHGGGEPRRCRVAHPATAGAAALLALSWIALSAARAFGSDEKPVLRFGMDTRAAPAAYVPGLDYSREDPRSTPTVSPAQLETLEGLDVDVMKALGRRLGIQPRVVPTSWYDLEKGLLEGRFDAILSSWTPTESTPRGIAASRAYYQWELLVVARADDGRIREVGDLAGLRVGHIPDPAVEHGLQGMGRGLGAIYDTSHATGYLLFDALRSRAIDALIFDSLYVRWRISRDPSFRIVGSPLNKLGYHVGVRSQDAGLLLRIDAAIHSLLGSKEMRSIGARWEGPS
jgi:ABC-type amino acid transport substrate-binding protein